MIYDLLHMFSTAGGCWTLLELLCSVRMTNKYLEDIDTLQS